MTEAANRYRRRADTFAQLIERTSPDRWFSPSPCAGWRASDVVAHVVGYSGHVLRERVGLSAVPDFEHFSDLAAAFHAVRTLVEQTLDDPETESEVVNYVDLAVSFDLPQHGWDLAMATGQDATIDPDEVALIWRSLSEHPRVWDWQREHGWYGPPVSVPDDAPLQDRVLGLLGRDPRWSPAD